MLSRQHRWWTAIQQNFLCPHALSRCLGSEPPTSIAVPTFGGRPTFGRYIISTTVFGSASAGRIGAAAGGLAARRWRRARAGICQPIHHPATIGSADRARVFDSNRRSREQRDPNRRRCTGAPAPRRAEARISNDSGAREHPGGRRLADPRALPDPRVGHADPRKLLHLRPEPPAAARGRVRRQFDRPPQAGLPRPTTRSE